MFITDRQNVTQTPAYADRSQCQCYTTLVRLDFIHSIVPPIPLENSVHCPCVIAYSGSYIFAGAVSVTLQHYFPISLTLGSTSSLVRRRSAAAARARPEGGGAVEGADERDWATTTRDALPENSLCEHQNGCVCGEKCSTSKPVPAHRVSDSDKPHMLLSSQASRSWCILVSHLWRRKPGA